MKRVGILQYGGTFERLAADPKNASLATYFGQQDTLRSVVRLGEQHGHCSLISARSPHPYTVNMGSASSAVGLGLDPYAQVGEVIDRIAALDLTHLLIQVPSPALITGVLQRQPELRLAAALADSFHRRGPRALWHRRQLVAALNRPRVEFVANHGPNAARHLVDIGVKGKPVVPFDFDFPYSPDGATVKPNGSTFGERILYVGAVSHDKGVLDLVRAMDHVRRARPMAGLTVIGDGPQLEDVQGLVGRLGLEGHVTVTGPQSHETVLARLSAAAVAVVPSRHQYGEGLPLTIYEAWATRTPLVATDHPMFRQRVIDGFTGLVVPERDSGAIGRALVRLLADPDLYRRLSENASIGWLLLKGSVGFWPLVGDWLDDRLKS